LERRFHDREEGVSNAYFELRRGIPGVVRTDITPEQLSKLLNDQLMQYSPADVKTIVESFPEQSRECAQFILNKAAGFASIESLRDLATAVQGEKLFRVSPGSLAENLSYICNRKNLFGGLAVETTDHILSATALILDTAALERLERDPLFARQVADKGLKLVNPRGFVSGINPFNTVTPAEIQSRVSAVLLSALTYQSQSSKDLAFAAAVDLALDTKMIERLLKAGELAGVGDKLLGHVIHVEGQDPGSGSASHIDQKVILNAENGQSVTLNYSSEELQAILSSNPKASAQEQRESAQPGPLLGVRIPDAESLARRLNGLQGMSASQVKHELDKIPEGYRASASELVARTSVVCSPRTLAYELRAMHGSIEGAARHRGVSTDNIYYLVPESKKSYGMVAMAYMHANDVPSDRFISSASDAKKDSLIVILDDVSGSGSSLSSSLFNAKALSSQHALAAPIVATSSSLNKFANIPHKVIGTLSDSDLVQGLDPYQARIIQDMVGCSGFCGNALCVSFAYMSPDNNNGFWSTHFAPYLTVSSKAVKGTDYTPPNEETARQIAVPALKKALVQAARVLATSQVDFDQEIALARTVDALTSVAVQFRIALSSEQQSILSGLHDRLAAQCETIIQRADAIIQEGQGALDFGSAAAILVDLEQAGTYLGPQRRDKVSVELSRRVKGGVEGVSQRIAGTLDTEISIISGSLDAPTVDLSTLNRISERTGELRKVATIIDRHSDSLAKIQNLQRSLFERTAAEFQSQQAQLSRSLTSPAEIPALADAVNTLEDSLKAATAVISATVGPKDRAEWDITTKISEIQSRNGALLKVAKAWTELVAFEQEPGSTARVKDVESLIKDFQTAGQVANVSADVFTDRAVRSIEQGLSRAASEALRRLEQGTLATAVEVRALATNSLRELSSLEHTTKRDLGPLSATVNGTLEAGMKVLESRVQQAIQDLSATEAQGDWYGLAIREKVNALAELSADLSLPKSIGDQIPKAWNNLRMNVEAAVNDLLKGVLRGEKPVSALNDACIAIKQLRIDSKTGADASPTLDLIESLQLHERNKQRAYEAKTTEGRLTLYVHLVGESLTKLLSHPALSAEVQAQREQLLGDIYKTIKPYLDFSHGICPHAPYDHLSVMKVLPRVADLFPSEERAEILSALSQRQRNAQLARTFFENKVPDFMGATFSPDEIGSHALELAAVLELVDELDTHIRCEFLLEQVVAAKLFAKAVQRSLESDPEAIGPEEEAAIRMLFRYEVGEGFFDEMSFCGFDRRGNRTASRARSSWGASESDSEIIAKFGFLNDFSNALEKTAEERRASINAVLGQVARFVGHGSNSASTTSARVLDTLGTDTQSESALAKYLAKYK
jgi:hypothetical protein